MAAKRRHQNTSAPENGRTKQTLQVSGKTKTPRKRDRENGVADGDVTDSVSESNWKYMTLVAALAVLCGSLHRQHISYMFESDRHFSHLSTLERELAFRTEMGLYYSYYKTICEAPTFMSGLSAIMYDNVTEYPNTINTLKRFNLYPEVVLGLGYRIYISVMSGLGLETIQCWNVNRGDGMKPVLSCEGLGELSYFYVESVFLLNGLSMSVFFLLGTFLSGSIMGGVLAVASFFFNHGESTRVQWTPPLRESFANPFLILEMLIVTYTLRIRQPTYKHSILIGVATVCFMLPWQFAQFVLMTQTVAVFGTYVLLFIGSQKMKVYLVGQVLGLLVACLCLFGNEMLLTSFYAASLITVSVIVYLEPTIEKLRFRPLIWVVQGSLLMVGTVGMKVGSARLLGMADDKHIGDILKSKFTNFKNFHTMLYTCAAEFDFMEKETPWRVLKTLLVPCALVAVCLATFQILKQELRFYRQIKRKLPEKNGMSEANGTSQDKDGLSTPEGSTECLLSPEDQVQYRSKPHAELVYMFAQLAAFTLMAVLIMRLKLFWTPHLCLLTSLLASPQIFGWLGWWLPRFPRIGHTVALVAVLGGMSVQGYANLQQQWNIQGEFSNYPLETLVTWINDNTPKGAVFGGPMPTMATIKLCTGRPIVNHPHYEDAGLRARTKKVYTMYSRKPAREVWENLTDLGVEYAILEESWCIRRSRPGCGLAEVWDLEDSQNQDAIPVCARLHKSPQPYFTRVFRNNVYDVLRVNRLPNTRL